MTTQHDLQAGRLAPAFKYDIGEDVVVSLDAAEIFDVETSTVILASAAPDWTIGRVIEHASTAHGSIYVLRFPLRDRAHVAIVREGAIDGVA